MLETKFVRPADATIAIESVGAKGATWPSQAAVDEALKKLARLLARQAASEAVAVHAGGAKDIGSFE